MTAIEVSRWRDPVWLAWLMVVAYLLHNFEEYGIDAAGRAFHFPVTACQQYGCRVHRLVPPGSVVLRRGQHPVRVDHLAGGRAVVSSQPCGRTDRSRVVVHQRPEPYRRLFPPMGYSPGTLTAAVIFIPLSLWIFITCFGRGRLRYPVLAAILLASILAQAILLGLLLSLSRGSVPLPLAITVQSLDPALSVDPAVVRQPSLAPQTSPRPSDPDQTDNSDRETATPNNLKGPR